MSSAPINHEIDVGVIKKRQRSSIGFPYMDLESGLTLARAIHQNVGLGDCDDSQLAAWSKQSGKSSTFRVQIYAARMFGLIEGESSTHRLTELGRIVLDPNQEKSGRVSAFLNVPLYSAIFEKYKGGTLPPTVALEREMLLLGVSDKQKDRARQVFEKSAEQASFFEHGKNRLVQPGVQPIQVRDPITAHTPQPKCPLPTISQMPTLASRDPLIEALIQKLPPSGRDAIWSTDDRIIWLQMISMAFQMTYGASDVIEIKKA